MLLNKRLVDAVSELIGSPNVLLHHTKAHIKPPGIGAPFPTHQVTQKQNYRRANKCNDCHVVVVSKSITTLRESLTLLKNVFQDYHYFPFKNDSMVAVFIHLDDSDIENGGLAVFPGSHKLGPQENASNVPTHFYVSQVN